MNALRAAEVNNDWSLIWENRDLLLSGLWTALAVAGTALIFSTVFGLLLGMGRMGPRPVALAASAYINVFRGIPALVSVIWVYFGVALMLGINFSVFQAGVIALTLLYSAFLAEVYRSALLAIPKGQREASLALGMSRFRAFTMVTLPQATKIALPNIGSMFIGMVKDTSTFTVIGLLEVVRVTQNINSTTFQPFVLYTAAAAMYVIVAFAVDFLFRNAELIMTRPATRGLGRFTSRWINRRVNQIVAQEEAEIEAQGLAPSARPDFLETSNPR